MEMEFSMGFRIGFNGKVLDEGDIDADVESKGGSIIRTIRHGRIKDWRE